MHLEHLQKMLAFYNSGATQTVHFRKQQLQKLKQTIHKYEDEICNALYTDLKKSKEEAFASEIGITIAEINYTLKNLHSWMKPKRATTNLLNLPSSSKIYADAWGVVFIIAPWNYPFQLLFNPLIAAIAGGNAVVLKPSELAPATAAIAEKICIEVFSPEHVFVVQGDGATVVPALIQSFHFNYIFYTGSISVGKSIYKMAAEQLIPVTLELGGKSACIVEPDANINVAANRIVMGKFTNVGQTCIAPDYILVHHSIKQQLVDALKNSIEKFYTSNAAESYDYGKIINEKRFDTLLNYLHQATIVYGGRHNKNNLFIEPTIIENVALTDAVMTEEIFGPILPILTYTTDEEALSIVKKNDNPLAFYLFTSNKQKEAFWMQNVSFGGGCINNSIWQFANHHLPFGGVGNSGLGVYHGKYGFKTFTRQKPVLKTPNWFDPSIKYPSFKGKLKLFKWLFK